MQEEKKRGRPKGSKNRKPPGKVETYSVEYGENYVQEWSFFLGTLLGALIGSVGTLLILYLGR